jgi:hypothetical protein
MRRGLVLIFSVLFVISSALNGVSEAQSESSPASTSAPAALPELDLVLVEGATEWSAGIGFGLGVGRRLTNDNSKYTYQALSWGRVLTGPVGPNYVRGRFEWALEVVPIFGQFDPDRTWGVGISPLVWRWNFDRRGSVAPFAEVGGGGLWTNNPLPADTVSGNFTAHVTFGMRKLTSARRGIVLAYRYDHISNGNRADTNPGVNAHVVYFGWTMVRPPAK